MNYGLFKIILALTLTLLFGWACKTSQSFRPSSGTSTAAIILPAPKPLTPLPVRELSRESQEMRSRAMLVAAKLRGLSFTSEVGMTELTGWEYGTRSREMAELLGGDDLRSLAKLAVSGGMLPPGTDLATLASGFAAASAGATYSPFDKQVLLVTRFKDDSLITHEYVHALQDQHYDLLKLLSAKPFNFDQTEAGFALVEGDAMNVQRRAENKDAYERRTLDEIYQQENERFEKYRREMGSLFPPLLTETFVFRYRDGARFVEAIRRNKKSGGIDAVFRQPPVSSEQVIHPEKYLAHEKPIEVNLNTSPYETAGWKLINSSPLGEIGIKGLLMASLPEKIAARAAAGWGGDRAFLFENQKTEPLFVWKSSWDTDKDADEFFQAYLSTIQNKSMTPIVNRINGSLVSNATDSAGVPTYVKLSGRSVLIIRSNQENVAFAAAAE